MATPKFPDVTVQLTGEDGNAFFILGRMSKALKAGGATEEQVEQFQKEATDGDYDHLLRTCMEWVNVD